MGMARRSRKWEEENEGNKRMQPPSGGSDADRSDPAASSCALAAVPHVTLLRPQVTEGRPRHASPAPAAGRASLALQCSNHLSWLSSQSDLDAAAATAPPELPAPRRATFAGP